MQIRTSLEENFDLNPRLGKAKRLSKFLSNTFNNFSAASLLSLAMYSKIFNMSWCAGMVIINITKEFLKSRVRKYAHPKLFIR